MSGLEFPPSSQPPRLPGPPLQPRQLNGPEEEPVIPRPAQPIQPERLVAKPLPEDSPSASGPEGSEPPQPAAPVSPSIVRSAIIRARGPDAVTPPGPPKPAPEFGEERKLAAVHAGAPIDRLVQCSIQPVDLRIDVAEDPRERLLTGIARGLEVPPDASQPLRLPYVEAKDAFHYEVEQRLNLPTAHYTARSPDSVTSNYAVGISSGTGHYSFVNVYFGANHSPEAAQAMTTAVARGIGGHVLANTPASSHPKILGVRLSVAAEETQYYAVPPADLEQFDANQDTHRVYYR